MDWYIILLSVLGLSILLGFIDPLITYIGGGISLALLVVVLCFNPQAFTK